MYNEFDGVKKRPVGLTVFTDTGGDGNEAVAIGPRSPGEPEMPLYLSEMAQWEWHRIVQILRDLNNLSPAYGPAIELYCINYGLLYEANQHIAEHGMVVSRKHGITVQSPYVMVARSATQICQRFLASFGLDPTSARNVPTPPVVDELETFLKKHG